MPKSAHTDAYRLFLTFLRSARKQAGLSQADLARKLGKPQQFVSLTELGVRRVDVIEFYTIMKALGVAPEQAFRDLVRILPDTVII